MMLVLQQNCIQFVSLVTNKLNDSFTTILNAWANTSYFRA